MPTRLYSHLIRSSVSSVGRGKVKHSLDKVVALLAIGLHHVVVVIIVLFLLAPVLSLVRGSGHGKGGQGQKGEGRDAHSKWYEDVEVVKVVRLKFGLV